MMRNYRSIAFIICLVAAGCKSASPPASPATGSPATAVTYPTRPATAPEAFKIFHHGNSSFTLTVNDKATDDQLSALVWQLRDAARTHSFDTIHIPQKQVDADGKASRVDAGVMPASLWNASLVRRTMALNLQTGDLTPVSVIDQASTRGNPHRSSKAA